MTDIRPPLGLAMDAFSVPIVVTLPYENPVTKRGAWVPPTPEAFGDEIQRVELRRIMAVMKSEVPALPTGTLIDAPEFKDSAIKTWKVDAHALGSDDEHHRVLLLEVDC